MWKPRPWRDLPFLSGDSVHFHDRISEETRERPSHTGGAEEQTLTECKFLGAIPWTQLISRVLEKWQFEAISSQGTPLTHCQIVCNARVEAGFGDTEKDTGDEKAMVA